MLRIAGLLLLLSQDTPFHDHALRLRDAIAEALGNSPDLGASEDALAATDIGARLAESRFDLKISPMFSAARDAIGFNGQQAGVALSKRLPTGTALSATLTSSSSSFGGDGTAFRDVGYTVAISQSLRDGFSAMTTADLRRARRAVQGSERALIETRRQLVVNVAEAYFAIVRQQRLAETSLRSRDRATKLLTASRARAEAGLATQLDVLRAELLAAQSDAGLAMQIEGLQAARDRLKVLLGRPVDRDLGDVADDLDEAFLAAPGIDATPPPSTRPPLGMGARQEGVAPLAIEELTNVALGSRLEVTEARNRIADARQDAALARWTLVPPVTLDVSYTQRGLGSGMSMPFFNAFNGWRVGVSTAYPLDRSAEIAAIDRAGISERAAARDARAVEQRVVAEVRFAHRAWVRANESIAIQEKAVGLSEKQLRLSELRYQRGLADNFDVIDAEASLFQAQSALIAAQIDRALAGLALRRATGRLNPEEFRR